jgi:hypothetical protein
MVFFKFSFNGSYWWMKFIQHACYNYLREDFCIAKT